MSATVGVWYNGTDITSYVLFQSTSFDSQLSAVPGTFECTVRDMNQELAFITGKEIWLTLDGVRMWGGYVTQISDQFALAVDDTASRPVSEVKTRQFVLRGVDYNILFDKRVLRNPSSYTTHLPQFDRTRTAGDLIRNELPKYLDIADIDVTTEVDLVGSVSEFAVSDTSNLVDWQQQGTTWREVMTQWASLNGNVWYIDANKRLHWHTLESTRSDWAFSDVPNRRPVTVGGDPLATYGFREFSATEDGSFLINDAIIWGGSAFGSDGNVLYHRETNEDSIGLHNRWQLGETHFGESGYGIQEGVTGRAVLIVEGSPSEERDQLYGFKNPQWQLRFSWHDHNLPVVGGNVDYPRAGKVFDIILYTFGESPSKPFIKTLPLRQVRISFPELKDDGTAYARFDGFFGLQTQDPWTLWKYLLSQKDKDIIAALQQANNNSESANYGAFGSFFPEESPDGSRTVFHIKFGYISGTTQVSLSGAIQRPGYEYIESDPVAGEITFSSPPLATDWIWVTALCLAG